MTMNLRLKTLCKTFIPIIVLVAVSQIIRAKIISSLKPVGSLNFIPGFIRLHYLENTGAAFGSFSGGTAFLAVFTGIIIVVGIWYLLSGKIKTNFEFISVLIVISGGLGNLVERILYGYVTDYFEFTFVDFAVFNFSDSLVTVGAILIVISVIIDSIKEKQKKTDEKDTIDSSGRT